MKRRWKVLLGVGVICVLVGLAISLVLPDRYPTIYHRADGTFSLNRRNGDAISPRQARDYFFRYESFGYIRLVGHRETLLDDWAEVISRIAESGAPYYQFEIDEDIFICHVPISTIEAVDSETPQIIPLVRDAPPPIRNMSSTDVLVMAGPSTTCAEIIKAAESPVAAGKSVCVISGERWLLRHSRGDTHRLGEFRRRGPNFREAYIQPVIDGIKTMF